MGNLCSGGADGKNRESRMGKMTPDEAASRIQAGIRGHAGRREFESRRNDFIYRAPTQMDLKIIACRNLEAADSGGSSDPFVQVHVGRFVEKTDTVKKSLNPVYNKTFSIEYTDREIPIRLEVMDWDALSKNDCIGKCLVDVHEIPIDEVWQKWISLEGANSGEVHVQVVLRDLKPRKVNTQLAGRSNVEVGDHNRASVAINGGNRV